MRPEDLDKIKVAEAYWLSPKGKIYEVEHRHINFIRDNLSLFKMSLEDYQSVYKKYKEPFGWEGKAREEILINAMQNGWCRLRNYGNKGWSIEVWELDNYTRNIIFDWAGKLRGLIESNVYGHDVVNIHVVKLEKANKPQSQWFIQTTFDKILKGEIFEALRINKIMEFEEFKEVTYKNINHDEYQMINEAGLSRLIMLAKKEDATFGIISGWRANNTKAQNNTNNKNIIALLNKNKMGPYLLIGHWQESSIDGDSRDYQDIPKDELKDIQEDSIFFFKNKEMSNEDFKNFISNLIKEYKQDAAIYSENGNIYLINNNNKLELIGNKLSLNKISQGYSQMKQKKNVPFIFEGTVHPVNNMGKYLFNSNGIKYII